MNPADALRPFDLSRSQNHPEAAPEDRPPLPQEIDDDYPLELDAEYWDALIPEDEYEPLPEFGDFWTDRAA